MDIQIPDAVDIPIDSILPSKVNPNHMSDFMFKSLVEGIKKDGFLYPVIIRKEDMRLVDGNHRWRAAKEAGLNIIKGIIIDITEPQSVRLGISLNQKKGYFDYAELRDLVINNVDTTDIGTLSYDIGFTETELQRLLEQSSFDSDKVVKQKLLDAGISSDKINAMADVYKTGNFQELPKSDVMGKQEGIRFPIVFFIDSEPDFLFIKDFFKAENSKEPDSNKLLSLAKQFAEQVS